MSSNAAGEKTAMASENWEAMPANDGPNIDAGAWQVFRVLDTGEEQWLGGTGDKEEMEWTAEYVLVLEADKARLEARLKAWEDAMTDVSVVNWTLAEDNAEDLHKQLIAVIAQNVQEAVDPTVSELAARADAAEADMREARADAERLAEVLARIKQRDGEDKYDLMLGFKLRCAMVEALAAHDALLAGGKETAGE